MKQSPEWIFEDVKLHVTADKPDSITDVSKLGEIVGFIACCNETEDVCNIYDAYTLGPIPL